MKCKVCKQEVEQETALYVEGDVVCSSVCHEHLTEIKQNVNEDSDPDSLSESTQLLL